MLRTLALLESNCSVDFYRIAVDTPDNGSFTCRCRKYWRSSCDELAPYPWS